MTETATAPEAAETSPAEDANAKKMHQYSRYVHVGAGAEECDHGEDGMCGDANHVHVWCRLPNQFERDSLREKAAAAEARKLRALRDPETDSRTILDGELESLVNAGEKDLLVSEIVNQSFLEDHLQALKEIAEEADGDYETIDEDRERLRALEEMSEEERPEEEFTLLRRRLSDHTEKVNKRRDELQVPKRASVEEKSVEELAKIVLDLRVESAGNQVRRIEYAKWEWYICTFKPKSPDKPGYPNERHFSSIDEFTHAASEVIEAISTTITALEAEAGEALKSS